MSTSSEADRQFDAIILGCGSAGTTAAKKVAASPLFELRSILVSIIDAAMENIATPSSSPPAQD